MKKFIYILSTFLFLSFSFNTINAFAQPESTKTLPQGIYSVRDANLLVGTPITVKATPTNSHLIILVIDSNQTIEALVRLNPQVTQQVLPPLSYDYSIVILGNGNVAFS